MRKAPFEHVEVHVTDVCCQSVMCVTCPLTFLPLIPGLMGSKKLIMGEEEVSLSTDCMCCKSMHRRPYGELGGVEKGNCLCFRYLTGDLFSQGGKQGCLFPGSACDGKAVDYIYTTLKERMANRGDTGQVRRAEEQLDNIQQLRQDVDAANRKLDAIMAHLRINAMDR